MCLPDNLYRVYVQHSAIPIPTPKGGTCGTNSFTQLTSDLASHRIIRHAINCASPGHQLFQSVLCIPLRTSPVEIRLSSILWILSHDIWQAGGRGPHMEAVIWDWLWVSLWLGGRGAWLVKELAYLRLIASLWWGGVMDGHHAEPPLDWPAHQSCTISGPQPTSWDLFMTSHNCLQRRWSSTPLASLYFK